MELTFNLIQLGLILIIIGLLLRNWEPPILGIVGMALGYLLDCGIHWGFIGAGLVFYKDKLVSEAGLVKESFLNLKGKKDKEQDKEETINE